MIKALYVLPVLAVLGMLSAADAQVTDTTPRTIDIGVLVPTTGAIAGLGTVINGTIAYAVSEFNGYLADNNRDWRLGTQVLDDEIDPNLSLTHVRSFDASGIRSFIGPITSASLQNIESYVNDNSMLAVSYGSTAPGLAKPDRIFRTITSDAGLGPALADRLVRDGITHVVPVYRDDVWGRALNAALHDSLSGTGINVLPPISYHPNTPNPAPAVVGQISSSVPPGEESGSAVVLFSFEEITSFVDTAISLDLPDARWYGTDAVLDPLLADEERSDFLSGAEYTIATLNVDPNRVNGAIDAAVPGADVYSYAAYDAVFILGMAIDLAGSGDDTAALAASIPGIAAAHASAVGDSTLNEFGDLRNGEYVYRTVVDGAFVDSPDGDGPDEMEPIMGDITIGALIPQTGRGDDAGEHRTLATELGVGDFNKYLEGKGAPWRLSVDIRDTAANAATALEEAKSLRASNVTLISGPSASSGVSAIKPYADANGLIVVSCCSTSPSLAVAGDNVFRLAPDDSNHGPVIADLVRTDGKEVLIPVWRNDGWGNGLQSSTADAFAALGGQVDDGVGSYDTCDVVDDPACYDADFAERARSLDATVAMHADRLGADKIAVLFVGFSETADFVRKAAEYPALRQVQWIGSDANVLDSSLVDDREVFEFLADVNFRSCIFAEDSTGEGYGDLEARFDRALDTTPNVYAYATYDTIWVMGLAIEAAGAGGGSDEIKRQIPPVASEYVGMLGDIELNDNGDLDESSYAVYGIGASGWVHIGTYVPGTGLVERSHGGGDSDSEWKKRPTFGMSDLTHSPVVSCGYSMDGICRDVLDYHVDYERETIRTNSTHDFALKAYSPINHMAQFQIAFGVPEVGAPVSEAEAVIIVDLARNYTLPSTYQVEAVSYANENNVIGEGATVSVGLAECMAGLEGDCVELSVGGVLFREQMHHEPFAIYAMDRDRRTATHYMNEGILIQGGSLNPAPQATAGIKKAGNQHAAEPIELVRVDKLGDLWEDQWGMAWTRNSFGTWHQLTQEPFERHPDAGWNVMDRTHSGFADLVQYEEDRAVLVWDGSQIRGVLGAPVAGDRGEPEVPRLERLAGMMALEASRAQALLDQLAR